MIAKSFSVRYCCILRNFSIDETHKNRPIFTAQKGKLLKGKKKKSRTKKEKQSTKGLNVCVDESFFPAVYET